MSIISNVTSLSQIDLYHLTKRHKNWCRFQYKIISYLVHSVVPLMVFLHIIKANTAGIIITRIHNPAHDFTFSLLHTQSFWLFFLKCIRLYCFHYSSKDHFFYFDWFNFVNRLFLTPHTLILFHNYSLLNLYNASPNCFYSVYLERLLYIQRKQHNCWLK
jgi:hypothetical protein